MAFTDGLVPEAMNPTAKPAIRRKSTDRATQSLREALGTPALRSIGTGAIVLVLGRLVGVEMGTAVVVAVSAGLVLYAVLSAVARNERETRSAQDGVALIAVLGAHAPPFGMWSIEADFGRLIAEEVQRREPKVVVECGAGASTILVAAYLRLVGAGHLYSVEHLEGHAAYVSNLLSDADLADWVDVIHTPLARRRFGRVETAWYDPELVSEKIDGAIDLLIVDGPPSVEPWTRWPALEVFHDRLAPGAVVLVDDGRQREARRIAHRWQAEHDDLEVYWHDTLKGTWRVVKRSTPRQEGRAAEALMAMRRRINPMPSGFGRWPVRR